MRYFFLIFLIFLQCIRFEESPNDPNSIESLVKRILFLPQLKEYLLASDTRYLYIIDTSTDEIVKVFDFGNYPTFKPPISLNPNTLEIAFMDLNVSGSLQINKMNLLDGSKTSIGSYTTNPSPPDIKLFYEEKEQALDIVILKSNDNQFDKYFFKEGMLITVKSNMECPTESIINTSNFWDFSLSDTMYFIGTLAYTSDFCIYDKANISNPLSIMPLGYSISSYQPGPILYNSFYDKVFLFAIDYTSPDYKIDLEIRNQDGTLSNNRPILSSTINNVDLQSLVWIPQYNKYLAIAQENIAGPPVSFIYHHLFVDDANQVDIPFLTTTSAVFFPDSEISKRDKIYVFYKDPISFTCYLKVYSLDQNVPNLTFIKDIPLPFTTNCSYLLELEIIEGERL